MWSAAIPKYFKSLSFSQLLFKDRVFSTHAQCLCSKRISDSSKSSLSQIDYFFFLLFFFHFGYWSQTNKRDFPYQQAIYKGCVAAPWFGSWLSSYVAFLHNAGDQLCGASPLHPGQLEQSWEAFPLFTCLRSLVSKCFVQCTSILSLAPHVLVLLVIFWGYI